MDSIDQIMRVMDSAFDPYWGEAWSRRQVIDSLTFPNTYFTLIGERGDISPKSECVAGFSLVRSTGEEEELLLLGVCPEFRGHGLGTRLLQNMFNAAGKRGAHDIFLEMRSNNPARSLYLANGFTPIGNRENYYKLSDGLRMDAITFKKSL
ncbi:MAG: GNAT family N-acetyltransferase [Sphingomonadaceae bacterium]